MQNSRAEKRSQLHPTPVPEWAAFEDRRASRPIDPERISAAYGRLMDAERVLYDRWERLNGSDEIRGDLVGLLLSLPVAPEGDEDLLWILGLGEKVAALGGHLEVRAVFDDGDVTLLSEPGPEGQPPIV